jgi:antitoxin component of MazEF toxin-antitoxin module
VELTVDKGGLTIRAARPRYQISDLISRIRPRNRHQEMDWGKSRGRES